MLVSLIVAMGRNRVIGADNALPWRLPADLRWFRTSTMGKPVVMGRRTHESIGRPLPGRHNIVLTRERNWRAPGCTAVHSVDEALSAAGDTAEVMVIGGADLYRQLLPRAGRIYLTRVHERFDGDAFFPEFDPATWREVVRRDCPPDAKNPYPHSFVVLERSGQPPA